MARNDTQTNRREREEGSQEDVDEQPPRVVGTVSIWVRPLPNTALVALPADLMVRKGAQLDR